MPSLLPVLVKHSLGNATALTRYSSQHLRNGRCEAPTYLAEYCLCITQQIAPGLLLSRISA